MPDKAGIERFRKAILGQIGKQVQRGVISPEKGLTLCNKINKEVTEYISSEALANLILDIDNQVRLDKESLFRHATGQVN